MANLEQCVICREDNSVPLIKLGEKGCQGIWRASKERGDNLDAQTGQYVHKECRRIYTNPNEIQKVTREKNVTSDSASIPKLRSKSLSFDFRTHCFICGQHVKSKDTAVYCVGTKDVQTSILKVREDLMTTGQLLLEGELRALMTYMQQMHLTIKRVALILEPVRLYQKHFLRIQKQRETEVDPETLTKSTISKRLLSIYRKIETGKLQLRI